MIVFPIVCNQDVSSRSMRTERSFDWICHPEPGGDSTVKYAFPTGSNEPEVTRGPPASHARRETRARREERREGRVMSHLTFTLRSHNLRLAQHVPATGKSEVPREVLQGKRHPLVPPTE